MDACACNCIPGYLTTGMTMINGAILLAILARWAKLF